MLAATCSIRRRRTIWTRWLAASSTDAAHRGRAALDAGLVDGANVCAEASKRAPKAPFDQLDVRAATDLCAPAVEAAVALARRVEPRLAAEGLGKLYDEVELPLSRVLARMERAGVLVDPARLATIGKRVEHELRRARGEGEGGRRAATSRSARAISSRRSSSTS